MNTYHTASVPSAVSGIPSPAKAVKQAPRLFTPEAGARGAVDCAGADRLVLEFDPAHASMERQGNDLLFTFNDGASLTVTGYFAASNGTPLPFILPDGTTASAEKVLTNITDFSTASGSESPSGSGSGEYADSAGDLLSGVDRLGSLGTDYWNGGRPLPEEPHARNDMPDAAGPQPIAPPLPPGPPEPPLPVIEPDYNARAVIYAIDPGKENSVTTRYLDSKGNPAQGDPMLFLVDGDGADYVSWSYDQNGNLVFTLTDEGKAFLADQDAPDYIEMLYRVTDKHTGESYTIQVVVPKDGSFDSRDFAENGSRHAGPVGDKDLIHGEWHEGDSDTWRDYQSTSSNLDDSYVLNGLYEGTDIRTGYGNGSWGNDRVEIRGDIDNIGGTVNVVTGKGQDTVSLYAMYANEGVTNLIDTGRELGDEVNMIWQMHAEGTQNASDATSRNSIVTGNLNLASQTNYGMAALNTNQGPNLGNNSAENIVDAAGDVVVRASQFSGWDAAAMHTDNQSRDSGHVSNTITADGDVSLLVNNAVNGAKQVAGMAANTWYATDHGTASNTIEAGGAVRMDIRGGQGADAYGMIATNNAANSIQAEVIDIYVSGSGHTAGVQSSTKDSKGNNFHSIGGKNTIVADDIRITAESSGGEAYAVITGKHGETDIRGTDKDGSFFLEARGASAYTVVTTDNGDLPYSPHTTHINTGGGNDSLSIRAQADSGSSSAGYAMGLYSGSTGHIRIDTGSGVDTVSIEARGTNTSIGMSAGSNKQGGKGWGGTDASNAIANAETVSVLGESRAGNGYGMFANGGGLPAKESAELGDEHQTGFNKILLGSDGTGDREVTVTGRALGVGIQAGEAYGMWAYNQQSPSKRGYNLIQGSASHGNMITVEAESTGGAARGMMSQGPSSRSGEPGSNIITGGARADAITVTAAGGALAIGMQAGTSAGYDDNPALNSIDSGLGADTITIAASSLTAAGEAVGMYALGGGKNLVTAVEGAVNVNVNGGGGGASGITGMGENAFNTVTAAAVNVHVTAQGAGDAWGMRTDHISNSHSSGWNDIIASRVELDVTAEGSGKAYGMMANLSDRAAPWCIGGVNTISALDGEALTVIIKVAAGSADDAYAMFASGQGRNEIRGGGKGDLVDLTGRIEGNNLIDTGAGNDTISLNGRVDASLILKAGDGHDLLILKAVDAQTFTDNYRTWLESMNVDQLRDMEIEEIWINGKEGVDWMQDPAMDWFWNFVDRYNDATGNAVFPDYAAHSQDAEIAALASAFAVEDDGGHNDFIIHYPETGTGQQGAMLWHSDGAGAEQAASPGLSLAGLLEDEGALSIDQLLDGLDGGILNTGVPQNQPGQDESGLSPMIEAACSQDQGAADEALLLALRVQAEFL